MPIIPSDVKKLVDQGYKVIVQPSTKRVFSDEEYRQVGVLFEDFAHILLRLVPFSRTM